MERRAGAVGHAGIPIGCDSGWFQRFAYQTLVARSVVVVNPGLRSTRGARLRSPGAKTFHRFAVSEPHALLKPAQQHAFNGWHGANEVLRAGKSSAGAEGGRRWVVPSDRP